MFICAVSSKARATKICKDINVWMKHIQYLIDVAEKDSGISVYNTDVVPWFAGHPPPKIRGYKWKWNDLSHFVYKSCEAIVDEVQIV
jgi:hypothetical protein